MNTTLRQVMLPLRDGIRLNAMVYLPEAQDPLPSIVTMTPYGADTYHDRGIYFAARGYPFVIVDVRGRGNSEGAFRPNIQEAWDGYDVVEWIACQPFCNGRVGMWGGSYAGYAQWATAKEFPPHLATIVPVAAPHMGSDVPMRNNIFTPETVQYLTLVNGRTTQWNLYRDHSFWASQCRHWFESGRPFHQWDTLFGSVSSIFKEFLAHPEVDAYWEAYNPTPEQYARLRLPTLTITGAYDDDQPGALAHYRELMRNLPAQELCRHYLVIGPWDHGGTRVPKPEVGGLALGSASLVDLNRLHLDWYAWTMADAAKPAFLTKSVAYYVTGAEMWRYADTLAQITVRSDAYFLQDNQELSMSSAQSGEPDCYLYDPSDVSGAAFESTLDPASLIQQRGTCARRGRQLIYDTTPFERAVEISGFFKLTAWISMDQPDTDFRVAIHEISATGGSVLLSTDLMRARYRLGPHSAELVRTTEPLRYDFERFTFVARRLDRGSRLRLLIGPINSIFLQKNFNSGGIVAEESLEDARPVTVRVYHDRARPSVLHVPVGAA